MVCRLHQSPAGQMWRAAACLQVLQGTCCTRPSSLRPCPYRCVPARFSFAATRQVLEGPCCTRPGSCASLRTGLNGFESLGRDLCNTGQNLCDVEGRLIHLALVNEASAAVAAAALLLCRCAVLLLGCCCAVRW